MATIFQKMLKELRRIRQAVESPADRQGDDRVRIDLDFTDCIDRATSLLNRAVELTTDIRAKRDLLNAISICHGSKSREVRHCANSKI